jgi:hypothetical protein
MDTLVARVLLDLLLRHSASGFISANQDHFSPLRGETFSGREADTRIGSRDNKDLILQLTHNASSYYASLLRFSITLAHNTLTPVVGVVALPFTR